MTVANGTIVVAEAIALLEAHATEFSMLHTSRKGVEQTPVSRAAGKLSDYALTSVVSGVIDVLKSGFGRLEVYVDGGQSIGHLKVPGTPRGAMHVLLMNDIGVNTANPVVWSAFRNGGSFQLDSIIVTVVPGNESRNSITLVRDKGLASPTGVFGCVFIRINRCGKVQVWDSTTRSIPDNFVRASASGRDLHDYRPHIEELTDDYKIDQFIFPGARVYVLEQLPYLAEFLRDAAPGLRNLAGHHL